MLVKSKSQFSVDETVKRIEANLKEKEIQVFALFDHGQNAKDNRLQPKKGNCPAWTITFSFTK